MAPRFKEIRPPETRCQCINFHGKEVKIGGLVQNTENIVKEDQRSTDLSGNAKQRSSLQKKAPRRIHVHHGYKALKLSGGVIKKLHNPIQLACVWSEFNR